MSLNDISKHPRRYFLIKSQSGKIGSLAPLTENRVYNTMLSDRVEVYEVTFAEWLPVAWSESDYTDACPTAITEADYWRQYG